MKVVVVAAGLDEPGAGPSYSVRRLGQALDAVGVAVELHCVRDWRGAPDDGLTPAPHRHHQDFRRTPVLSKLCLSQGLDQAVRAAAVQADVIHAHGLWLAPNLYPAWASRKLGVPLMVSPRGMLGRAALGFSSRRKRLAWALIQGAAVRQAACLHATSETELDEIRAIGLIQPVAVIANGVDLAPPKPASRPGVRTLLTLGRLHPKKGLPNLLAAWAQIEARFADWRLRIVGPDENGHAAELSSQARGLGLQRVSLEGPLFGQAKIEALQAADLFVLPTLNENFALTVAEALAAGTPVVASQGAPWSGLETHGCGWWVDAAPQPLAQALASAMGQPTEALARMGEAGRNWMARDFGWTSVAADMAAVYGWLAGARDAPDHVRFD